MIKALVLAAIAMTVVGCGEQNAVDYNGNQRHMTSNGRTIFYFYDDRTNMCFAENNGYNAYSMAAVPCTDEVKRAITADGKEIR